MTTNVFSRASLHVCAAAALGAWLLALGSVAHAEDADSKKPIVWSAEDPFEGNIAEKAGTLRKNVIITQGTTTIHADRVDLKQNADSSMSTTAFGNPVSFRQKREGSDEYNEAYAKKIVYDGATGVIELFDNALLKQGASEVRGNYFRYDTRTEKFIGEARPDAPGVTNGPGDRVRGVFMPRPTATVPGVPDKAAPGKDGKSPAAPAKATAAPAKSPASTVPLKSDTELKSTQ